MCCAHNLLANIRQASQHIELEFRIAHLCGHTHSHTHRSAISIHHPNVAVALIIKTTQQKTPYPNIQCYAIKCDRAQKPLTIVNLSFSFSGLNFCDRQTVKPARNHTRTHTRTYTLTLDAPRYDVRPANCAGASRRERPSQPLAAHHHSHTAVRSRRVSTSTVFDRERSFVRACACVWVL